MADEGKVSNRAHILIVEDSSVFREMQSLLFRQAGYAVSAHEHPRTALAAARERHFDLVVIDYELPGMNGQQFMHELRKIVPAIHVIFVSGSLTLELAIQLSREGVAGIFNKPANPKNLIEKINDTLYRTAPRDAAQPAKGSLSPLPAARRAGSNAPFAAATTATPSEPSAGDLAYSPRHFLGQSDAFRELTHRLWKVRDFRTALLLQGEPGSPFEAIARDLAETSIFRDGPVMTCRAEEFDTAHLLEVLAPTLLAQDAGTLVVTGVETFTPAQQKILQTLLASREMFQPFARRFRIVLAAAASLADLADNGQFNDTLFYKISTVTINVPPLGELRGDILPNVRRLLDERALAAEKPQPYSLTTAAATWLESQPWPGNFDQLVRVVLAAAGPAGGEIDEAALAAALRHTAAAPRQTRSPFVAKPAAPPPPAPAIASPVVSAHVVETTTAPAAVAAPSRAVRPAAPLTARALFRTEPKGYSFALRLAEILATADARARG
ncbi:MAG: response regulator [Verrucomicrobia bacterium]|nr:response regulator [Verrucomicrobiota bacterium]